MFNLNTNLELHVYNRLYRLYYSPQRLSVRMMEYVMEWERNTHGRDQNSTLILVGIAE
jgi:hypothetical protein